MWVKVVDKEVRAQDQQEILPPSLWEKETLPHVRSLQPI